MAAREAQVSARGFDRLYGLDLVELGDQSARAKVTVHDQLRGPSGTVHGGVYAAIAQGLTITATERAVDGETVAALSIQTSLLRPITEGTIDAVALARHRGRTTWVWEVEMTDDEGRLCAAGRVTIAIGAKPG
jgi:1,4-dihydroxy-2-naphthoyl-CoA hydrolase